MNTRVPFDDDYVKLVGTAVYLFSYYEWTITYVVERLEPGFVFEVHVPFYERLGVQFPRPTHRAPQQAVGKMTEGPSKSAVRSRLQTTPSGCHEEWRS